MSKNFYSILEFKKFKNISDMFTINEEDNGNGMKIEERLSAVIDEIVKNVEYWFKEGKFSMENISLVELEKSFDDKLGMRNIICNFEDENSNFQLIIDVPLNLIVTLNADEKNNGDFKGIITIKKYDKNTSELIRQYKNDVKLKNITEDFIIERISKFDEITSEVGGKPVIDNDDLKPEDNYF